MERHSPMKAARFLRERDQWHRLGAPAARTLSRELRKQGYLADGRRLLADVVEARQSSSDQAMLARVDAQIGLLQLTTESTLEAADLGPLMPNRVLHVVKHSILDSQTGYTLRTQKLAAAQARAGIEPHVVNQLGLSRKMVEQGGVLREGVRYHSLGTVDEVFGSGTEWFDRHVDALASLVRTLRPAVLHAASDYVNAMAAQIVGRAYGIPVVYEFRGFWEETMLSSLADTFEWGDIEAVTREFGHPDTYTWRQESERRARSGADALVTLSPIMADYARAGADDGEPITIVPNAVDPDEFVPIAPDRELLKELGFTRRTTVIGYISSLSEYEGIEILIRAFAQLRAMSATESLALLIVGTGKHIDHLRSVARDVGEDGIVFTGQVPHAQVIRYYSVIDIFVVPRLAVTVCRMVTPLKPYEAFALERCVVMSDVEALAGIARESGSVELFTAGDITSLRGVLRSLLDDPERRRELAQRGREWVVEHRTWALNAQAYRRLYAGLTPLVLDPDVVVEPPSESPASTA